MSANYSLERDLHEIVQMGASLRVYLLGDQLYLAVGGGLPQLTLGAFLLRRRRLKHFRDEMNAARQAMLDKALGKHEALRRAWPLHYETKLKREASSRLRALHGFFRECEESGGDCAAAYPVEAARRTLVQEILMSMDDFGWDKHELMAAVRQSDFALRSWLTASAFIWSPKLASVYPRDVFWWLYGRPDAMTLYNSDENSV